MPQGRVLLRVDDALQQAQLRLAGDESKAAIAQRDQACLAAERAGRDRERTQRLSKDGLVSSEILDRVESEARGADATCRAARAAAERAVSAVALAQAHLDQTVLKAPFDGIVADTFIEEGEWTSPSPPALPIPPVLDLIDTRSIYVSAPMDEVDSGRIRKGQPARLTVDSRPGRSFAARVVEVAPYVVDRLEQNRTVEIEIELDDAGEAASLLPGTSADAEVILSGKDGVLRVPTASLIEGGKVLVLERGRLVEKTLQLGLRNWDFTEVAGGLEEGARVVVSLDRPEIKAGAQGPRVIRLEGLSRTFDVGGEPVHALVDVSEEIAAGEHVAIMGPSGSGKSTLLHILGCLDRPDRGAYELDGARRGPPRRGRAEPRPPPHDRLRLPVLPPRAAPHRARERRAADGLRGDAGRASGASGPWGALRGVGLEPRASHRPDQLSGGERQRVAIARAIVIDPTLLLADEPTGNLDTASGRDVLEILEQMNAAGLTLIVVTHDPAVARRARRILVLEDGRVVHRGDGAHIHEAVEILSAAENGA